MARQPTSPPEKPAKKDEAKTAPTNKPSKTREELDNLKDIVSGKKKTSDLMRELLEDYKDLSPEERKQRMMQVLSLAALNYVLDSKKDEEEKKKKPKKRAKNQKTDQPQKQPETDEEETEEKPEETEDVKPEETEVIDEKPSDRKVVCSDRRLICINTHPVSKPGRPSILSKHSSYLTQYGLPEYDTFKREMIGMLAPDASTEEAGIKKVMRYLKYSPMGKYQCMPRYLFPHVDLPYEGEEGLKAMWKFLQSEELQRNACRGYITKLRIKNPLFLAAAYYGGADEIKKMRAYVEGKGNDKNTHEMEKKQKQYPSIIKYARRVEASYYRRAGKGGDFDIEAMLDAIADNESGSLEGKVSLPRDEKWENDKRYKNVKRPNGTGVGTETGSETAETKPVPKIDTTEFRKGSLMDALAKHAPYATIEGGPRRMELRDKRITVQGVPGWSEGRRTEGWDHKSAGNTEASIQEGRYTIDMVKRPGRAKKVPHSTHLKLEQIAIALQFDPRMPLFTGIDMVVDGIKVTMVKEIHCTPKGQTTSTTIGQPHIGTAYFVRS